MCARARGAQRGGSGAAAAAASETPRAASAAGPHPHRPPPPPPLRGREQRGGAEARGRARAQPGGGEGRRGSGVPFSFPPAAHALVPHPRVSAPGPAGAEPAASPPAPGRKLPGLRATGSGTARSPPRPAGCASLGTPAPSPRGGGRFPVALHGADLHNFRCGFIFKSLKTSSWGGSVPGLTQRETGMPEIPHAGTGRAAAPARDPVLRVRATPGPGVSAARGRASPRLGSTCAGGAGGGAAPAPPPRSVRHSCERSHPDLFAPSFS